MKYTWLGYAAGIVTVGVATTTANLILLGGEIVIHRQNWELARVLVPVIISVLGWLVTIWWALRQLEISSDKNRAIQHEILTSNEKTKAIDSVISACININDSIHKIQIAVGNFKTNIEFKEKGKTNPNFSEIFIDSNLAYSELFSNIEALTLNLARAKQHKVDIDKSVEFINKVDSCFQGKSVWYKYQEEASVYLQNTSTQHDDLFSAIAEIFINCAKLRGDMISTVKNISDEGVHNSVPA